MSIHNPGLGGPESSHEQDWKQEESLPESEKANTLQFIIETGRARTPEAAELYLERLNDLKRKIFEFLQNVVVEKHQIGIADPLEAYRVAYLPDAFRKSRGNLVDNTTIGSWRAEDIDATDPHIWSLLREVDSNQDGSAPMVDQIRIQLANNGAISIPEQMSGMAWNLRKYLSPEELQLLGIEFGHENVALVKKLREEADELERTIQSGYHFPTWRPVLEQSKTVPD